MNILYQKSKLLGRPFRNAEDDGGDSGVVSRFLSNILSGDSAGDFISLLSNTDKDSAGDFISLLANAGGDSAGDFISLLANAGGDSAGDFVSLLANAGAALGGESLAGYIDSGAASAEEAAAITKALADAKVSDLTKIPKGVWDTLKGFFKTEAGGTDWGKLGMAGGALLSATGLGKAQPGGYQGVVPKQVATRQQITYDDPNRRPGAGGRDYFTDTIYSPEKDTAAIDAAKAASQTQAEGILAGYKKADVATPATTKFKTPWEKAAGTGAGAVATGAGLPAIPNAMDIAQETYPEKFVDNTTPVVRAAGGTIPRMPSARQPRYLQGITDGMEDKIKTTIDGEQDALLSHGEFVIPADVVSHLGNGNSDAGAKKLYQMMDRVRQARTGNKKQGKQINPDKFMPGGQVGYDKGGIVAFESGGVTDTTTSSGLAPYVGDYTTKALGDFQAASTRPYEGFKGPLTAGASDLQTSAFAGIKDLATTGYTPGTFTTGTFDTAAANQYMNPYLNASLNPQLKELRRQAQITNLGSLAKAGRAGIMSGDSRNLMEAENMRNLLSKQSDVLGTGYATAYDKAMDQFNKEQGRSLEVQKADEESRKTSADYSRNVLNDMAKLGQTQRDIDAEGIAADIKEFENQRDYDLKSAQARIGLLQKLPVGSSTTEANTNPITDYLKNSGTIIALFKQMGLIK
jgi:hypothetical protein